MSVNSLPETVTRQRRGCTLTTRLPSHYVRPYLECNSPMPYLKPPTIDKTGQRQMADCPN